MAKQIIIRADGNKTIGFGHVYRCLALAQMLIEDFECWFYIQVPEAFLKKEIKKVVHGFKELPVNKNLDKEAKNLVQQELSGDEIVVLDGYDYDLAYQETFKANGNPLVFIDDLADKYFVADLVINHAGSVDQSIYSCEAYTKLLLGLDYLIVREDFIKHAEKSVNQWAEKVNSVFVCFGASNRGKDALITTIKACSNIKAIEAINVVSSLKKEELSSINKKSGEKVQLYQNLEQEQLMNLMGKSDFAIVPSSTLSYEVCCLKKALLTGYFVVNQQLIYNGLMKHQCAAGLSGLNNLREEELQKAIERFIHSPIKRKEICNNQATFFQGQSKRNLLSEFLALC